MTEYAIVSGSNEDEVTKEVNGYLVDGWELQGGICVTPETENTHQWLWQAMVRTKND